MNVPAIAQRSFEELKSQIEFVGIVHQIINHLKSLTTSKERAHYIHKAVDDYNVEAFAHPLVKQFSPCKMGCTACCHTQVSVTGDEAELLAIRVREGVSVDLNHLNKQAVTGNDSDEFYKLSFEERKCVFLDEKGACKVYEDRPSVCRTNAVLGTSSQCDTSKNIQKTLLVKTAKADMVIYASYVSSPINGTLPYMLGRILTKD